MSGGAPARLRYPTRGALGRIIWRVGWRVCELVMLVGYRLRREHTSRMPEVGALLIVSNHQSHLDPIIVGMCARRRDVHFVARSTLFNSPAFAWLIKTYGAIPIRQDQSDAAAMRVVLDKLKQGAAVHIFPEGSRSQDGRIEPFKRGMLLLLRRANCQVLPVAVEGAFDTWPRSRTLPRLFTRLAVRVGEPIDAAELLEQGADAALARLREEIEAMRLELRAELRRRSGNRYPPPGPADEPGCSREPADDGGGGVAG